MRRRQRPTADPPEWTLVFPPREDEAGWMPWSRPEDCSDPEPGHEDPYGTARSRWWRSCVAWCTEHYYSPLDLLQLRHDRRRAEMGLPPRWGDDRR
jgi:hypothetical protein